MIRFDLRRAAVETVINAAQRTGPDTLDKELRDIYSHSDFRTGITGEHFNSMAQTEHDTYSNFGDGWLCFNINSRDPSRGANGWSRG